MRFKKTMIVAFSAVMIVLVVLAYDIDADGLLTYRELFVTKTNPLEEDSDSDGIDDGYEIMRGTDPLAADTDQDGLLDGDEVLKYNTDPLVADFDLDQLLDSQEIALGTDPENPDTDNDGLFDTEPFPLDGARPSLAMNITGIGIRREGFAAILSIGYGVLADGAPLDDELVWDSDIIIGKLDWNNFHLLINGTETQAFKSYKEISYPLGLASLDIRIEYRENNQPIEISKLAIVSHPRYNITEISDYWKEKTIPAPSRYGSCYSSMQQTFDQYAKVYSGLLLMRDHVSQLKREFTSPENWYLWLLAVFKGTTSLDVALAKFHEYAQSSGMLDLVTKLWNEVDALLRSIPQLKTVLAQHESSVIKALRRMASNSFSSVTGLVGAMNGLESISSGSSLERAIDGITMALQEIYAQLCSDFFGWVKENSPIENEVSAADGAQWYMDNLGAIRSLKNYYGVSFSWIIETNHQYINVGERGVAWWPARYSYFIMGSDIKFPFHIDASCSTSFPLSEVHWEYTLGPYAGEERIFQVFLATESIVQKYLKENGFTVSCLPPTEEEGICLQQALQISQFFIQKLSSNLYLNNQTLSQEISRVSELFYDFQSIEMSLGVVRKYGSSLNFLEELNKNVVQIVLE